MSGGPTFDWAQAPLGAGVTVLRAHPCGLAALDKPAGVLSHPNRAGEEERSLLTAHYREKLECFEWTDSGCVERRVWLLHRLDSATSGVVLVAADADVAAAVRTAFEDRRVRKLYLAVVLGHARERRALWRDEIDVQHGGTKVRAANAGGMHAETMMRCLRLLPGPPALSLLELEPHTGRTHQLRHQCARRHLPILGDQNYGNFARNRDLARRFGTDRLFLHAKSVALDFALAGNTVNFSAEAPDPEEFATVLGAKK